MMFCFNTNSSNPGGDMPQTMNILLRVHTAPIGCSYDSIALSPPNPHDPTSSQDSFYDDDFHLSFKRHAYSFSGTHATALVSAPRDVNIVAQTPASGRSVSTTHTPASINTIPTELLQEVFKCCLRASFADPYIAPDSRSAPLLFGQVCRHWRRVSHTSSELWASLAVKHTSRPAERALVRAWLARSQGRKLAISFMSPIPLSAASTELPSDPSGTDSEVPSISDILASHASQIHTLSLRASWPTIEALLCRLARLPQLCDLTLHQHPGSYAVHITPGLLSVPHLLPSLRSFSLTRCSDACITAQPALAARLTSLRVTLQRGFDLSSVLAACPALKDIVVRTPGYPDNNLVHLSPGTHTVESPLEHANLRTLTLELDECAERSAYLSYLAGVLCGLVLPMLSRVTCTLLNEDEDDVCISRWALLSAVQGLAGRSERPLEHVEFVGFAPVLVREKERVVRAMNARDITFITARQGVAMENVCYDHAKGARTQSSSSSSSNAKLEMVHGMMVGSQLDGPCYL